MQSPSQLEMASRGHRHLAAHLRGAEAAFSRLRCSVAGYAVCSHLSGGGDTGGAIFVWDRRSTAMGPPSFPRARAAPRWRAVAEICVRYRSSSGGLATGDQQTPRRGYDGILAAADAVAGDLDDGFQKAVHACGRIAAAPAANRQQALAGRCRDRSGRHAVAGQKHDPRPPNHLLRRVPVPDQPLHPLTVSRTDRNPLDLSHRRRLADLRRFVNPASATEH